ncbi:hypothetical protein K8I85_07165 [bacterium]|nr:hypothetical protein [bacterium]
MSARHLALLLLTMVAVPATALERTEVRADREAPDAWDAGETCAVTYGNTCTGWVYARFYEPYDVVGVTFEPCCSSAQLVASQLYFYSGFGEGWGFTGTVAVREVVDGCLGETYDARPAVPLPGPRIDSWTGIPQGPVAVTFTHGEITTWWNDRGVSIAMDHPAAGPTGPAACGFCYPTTRPTHAVYYGKPDSLLCPGSPVNDGTCNSEFLWWSGSFSCPVSTEPMTWGSLKNLYR